jgi:hypothetical protein
MKTKVKFNFSKPRQINTDSYVYQKGEIGEIEGFAVVDNKIHVIVNVRSELVSLPLNEVSVYDINLIK